MTSGKEESIEVNPGKRPEEKYDVTLTHAAGIRHPPSYFQGKVNPQR